MRNPKWNMREVVKWFPQWETDLRAPFPLWPLDMKEPGDEASKAVSKAVISALIEIFSALQENANVRAKWQKPGMYAMPLHISIEYDFLDSYCGLSIGLESETVWLAARLRYTAYLSSVADDFWLELAELYRHGDVKLSHGCLQGPVIGKEYNARFIKDSRSVFYMLLRNHILCGQQGVEDEIFGLEVHWSRFAPLNELFPKMLLAFESLYKLEKWLQRQAYVVHKSRLKRTMKKHGITMMSKPII